MKRVPLDAGLHTHRPPASLQPFVSQVWLGLDNREASHDIVPDGCVDVVLHVAGGGTSLWAYGTTTQLREEPIAPGHYLGIRFRPGMARHFLDIPATDLTDRKEGASAEFALDARPLVDSIDDAGVFACVDQLLLDHVARIQPRMTRVDAAVLAIDAGDPSMSIANLASEYGKGRRQFERDFLRAVGIPAKQYAVIARFHRAARRLSHRRPGELAAIAADAGYADQSHMVRDFQRLAGAAPSAWKADVAIVQDR